MFCFANKNPPVWLVKKQNVENNSLRKLQIQRTLYYNGEAIEKVKKKLLRLMIGTAVKLNRLSITNY